jgi:hypothetical protein
MDLQVPPVCAQKVKAQQAQDAMIVAVLVARYALSACRCENLQLVRTFLSQLFLGERKGFRPMYAYI